MATPTTKPSSLSSGAGGNVRSTPIAKVTGKNLDLVLSAHVDPGAVLMTDENRNYKSVGLKFREHHTVNHRDGEYVRGDVTTNTVEGYFANLKRGLDGVYHHVRLSLPRAVSP